MKRRSVLAAAGATAAALAGCPRPIGEATPEPRGLVQAGPGDYPHDIYVHNALGRDVRLTLTVDRADTRIYRETHTVAAETGTVIAGITRRSLPDGNRRLTITARLEDGRSAAVDVDVTDCLGSVDFSVNASGELHGTYSIC